MKNQANEKMIDLMKYICSILVIMVHTTPFLPFHKDLNWFTMTILGRFVVPFYFLSTGFFVFRNIQLKSNNYFKSYLKGLLKTYLIWSILYLPLGLQFIYTNLEISFWLYPVALLIALFYIGTYFHLWYISALIFSLIAIYYASKFIKKRYLVIISFCLLVIGSFETYYGYLFLPLKNIFDIYINIFFTTRNGLFFGLFYVCIGYILANTTFLQNFKHTKCCLFLSFLVMILEAIFIHESNNLDSNILLSAAPFTIFLFLYCFKSNIQLSLPYKKMRAYSSLYYFTHAYFLILIPMFLSLFQKNNLYNNNGFFRFFSVLLCTHICSYCIRKGTAFYNDYKSSKNIKSI